MTITSLVGGKMFLIPGHIKKEGGWSQSCDTNSFVTGDLYILSELVAFKRNGRTIPWVRFDSNLKHIMDLDL